MSINLHALMLFYQVASTGSVTEASKRLNISQPAISTQIRSFEKQNRVHLFEKKGRNLTLTPFGKKLLIPAGRLFQLAEQIEIMIDDYHQHPCGRLRITGNYLASSLLIPQYASLFKQKYPEVKVEISTVNTRQAIDRLINYEADAAIIGNSELSEQDGQFLQCRTLYKDEFMFVSAPNHRFAGKRISMEDVMQEPFIMREEGSTTRKRLMELCRIHQVNQPNIELQFNGLSETIQAVIAGYGVSFVSSLIARQYFKRGELVQLEVEGEPLSHHIVLCSRHHNELEEYVRDFLALVIRCSSSAGT